MRSYGEYCGLARALDVIGQRWSLLIVRELLLRGPCRYTDLQAGLPGIATNLLTTRIRELEEAGVLIRELAPPPVATTLIRLTPRGRQLEPVLDELARWGAPLMAGAPGLDAFRSHWLLPPIKLLLRDGAPHEPPLSVEARVDGEPPIVIETVDGVVRGRLGPAEHADAVLAGPPEAVVGLLFGGLTLPQARALGLSYQGPSTAIARIALPSTPTGRAQ
jgi:DNA-binding HxlR family transcriptional regulator